MTIRNRYWVVPSDGGWDVKHEARVLSRHFTKPPAVTEGRRVAKNDAPSQLIILRLDGRIEDESTYLGDPYPPKG